MPASYSLDMARRVVMSRAWGTLTVKELARNREALRADPGFEASFAQFYDFSDVESLAMATPEIRALARGSSPFSTSARRAFCVRNDVQFGLARLYMQESEHWDNDLFRVFRGRHEALAWVRLV